MATYPFDVDTPPSSQSPTLGDNRIRELKNGLHERLNKDGYWEKSGSTCDADDIGYSRKTTLLVQATAPTAKANAGIVYSKDVGSPAKAELFYRDEDGDEVQITSGGNLSGGTEFVAGDLLLSSVDTAHSGWTEVTSTYADKYLRVGTTVLGTGGSAIHTHGAGSYASQDHTLTISASNTYSSGVTAAITGDGRLGIKAGSGNYEINRRYINSDITTNSGGGTAITGTSASGANTPLWVDTRMFKKD